MALRPDAEPQYWDMSLDDAVRTTLANSKVMNDLGGMILQKPQYVADAPGSVDHRNRPAVWRGGRARGV